MSDCVILHGTRLRFAFRMPIDSFRADECAEYCRPLGPQGQIWDWDWIRVGDRHLAQFRFLTREQCEAFAIGAFVGLSGFEAADDEAAQGSNLTPSSDP